MKKLILLLLVLCLILSACGGGTPAPTETEPTVATTEPVTEPVTEPTTEPVTEPLTEATTEPVTEPSTEPVTEATTQPVTEPAPDYEAFYAALLENYTALLAGNAQGTPDMPYFVVMLAEQLGVRAGSRVGYLFEDISGDDVPELLIGEINRGRPGVLYAVYTLDGEVPVLVLEGGERSVWYYGSDGVLLNSGSAGAIYSIFGSYVLSPDGKDLVCQDYYYTHEVDGDFNEIGCYRNSTGEMTGAAEERQNMTIDDFWGAEESFLSQAVRLELTPFGTETWLEVGICEEPWAVYEDYELVELVDESGTTQVVFEGDHVSDLKILSLAVTEVLEDGTPVYEVSTAYEYGSLTVEKPLVIPIPFYGSMPSWGFSYVDQDGVTHRFDMNLSGYDGSVVISGF